MYKQILKWYDTTTGQYEPLYLGSSVLRINHGLVGSILVETD